MDPLIAPYTPTSAQLAAQLAAQRTAQANNNSDPDSISSIGTFFNLPSIFDTNNQQARQDALTGATDIFGNILRGTDSSAYKQVISTPAYTLNGVQYNAAGDVINSQSTDPGETNYDQLVQDQLVQDQINQINQQIADQQAAANAKTALDTANERAAYGDQITELDKLLGYAGIQKGQGMQRIADQYDSSKTQQEKVFNNQRQANTQNQEKGYNEVSTFANTSNNNLNRLLQGANAGRSSVGQVLAPYMVGRAADTRRQAVTNTAGENMRTIDMTSDSTLQDLLNQRKKNEESYQTDVLNTEQDLESQKRTATIGRDMAKGMGYEQAAAGAANLTANMDNRRTQLSALFEKYKPDYSIKEAPALSTYQVDPAQIKGGQNTPGSSDFYLNQLKRKKELGL